jgi:HK97 family phage prohead protease
MKIEGWASTPNIDHALHIVAAGAFDKSIKDKGLNGPKSIKLLHQHSASLVLGKIDKLETRQGGLWLEGEIEEDISYGKDVAAAAKAAGGLSFSVGFIPLDADIDDGTGYDILVITEGELLEVSVVTFPCQPDAVFTGMEG